jgi:hypothetical protein
MKTSAPVFQFKTGRSRVAKSATKALDYKIQPEPEPPAGDIHGEPAGSTEEWRVSQALNKLDLGYEYQIDLVGGNKLPGGQILDFLVFTKPLPTPIYINGDYWHRASAQNDALKQAAVVNELGGFVQPPKVFWTHQLTSIQDAIDLLRRELL